jgi:Amt family ammonium transporter
MEHATLTGKPVTEADAVEAAEAIATGAVEKSAPAAPA